MNCIELMVEEHRNIKRMLFVIRSFCKRILNGQEVSYVDFFSIIDFVRNYADKHHHGKEESMLFARMAAELGPAAEKLVRYGMNVEHDLGRLHVQNLEAAVKRVLEGDNDARLDVIAEAVGYANLLTRHIDKEDGVVYRFAQNNFSRESMEKLEQECRSFELKAEEEKTAERYLKLLEEMEAKLLNRR